MTQERIPVPPRSNTEQKVAARREGLAATREDKTPEEAETLAQKKAKLAQVLQRGMVADRLKVKNPDPDKVYEWIREEDTEMERHLALGFALEMEDGSTKNRLHDTGDNRCRVGDVVLMSTSVENYELIQQVRMDQKAKKSTLGKEEYLRRARSARPDVPILDPLGVGQKLGMED